MRRIRGEPIDNDFKTSYNVVTAVGYELRQLPEKQQNQDAARGCEHCARL